MNKLISAIATAGLALLGGATAQAASFPEKPVTIIVPFVPGGSSDITARSVMPGMQKLLGQSFVAENKPGANSAIGAQALARSPADGYTMMVGSIGTFAINEALYKELAYNPSKDFKYLTQAVRNPNILVAPPSFPPNTVAELVEYAKKHPGEVSYASSGTGSSDHLSAILFRQRTGTTGVDVPYRGGAAAIADLLGAQVNVSFQNLGAVQKHVLAGKLKALAITGDARAAELPNVPTLAEAGIKDMVVYSWQGFAVPKDTPAPVVKTLSDALRKTLREPDVTKTLQGLGFEVVANSPEDFAKFQQAEVQRWKQVIKEGGIQLQ
ncbi:Bug family tripartite tricarboxylate transporter substrate binding protein [Bordetella petrii]|uniref:Bug family tripartite tricarboxylate transporter substrate binding protein n=1 Tax=Bordetella petrii TaxID=94624 RepID=UPI001E648E83|nr:tripartite tricarboxylate transporter substrate binding protein [Bordetella petrii]MCD0505361.1 tripartite tricarboxylate transporter substrate binding protein [Bordetella petrii]